MACNCKKNVNTKYVDNEEFGYTELKKVYSRGDLLITSSNYVYNKYSIANLIKAEDLLTLRSL